MENATQKEPSSEEQRDNNTNNDNDDDAVEMSEDFEGTVMDLPEQEEEEDSSDDDGDNKNDDIADKMGELEKKEHEGLDKNMWAPEDEDNKVVYHITLCIIAYVMICVCICNYVCTV